MSALHSTRVTRFRAGGVAVFCSILLAFAMTAGADVHTARERWKTAQEQEPSVLAPKRNREAGVAMTALEAAPNSDAALKDAETRLQALEVALRRAHSLWSDLLEVRERARKAKAPTLDPRGWMTAENTLIAAAQKLEAGRGDAARLQGREAQPLYETARWNAMRTDLVGVADSMRVQLEAAKARQLVPRSYVRTIDAIAAAQHTLNEHGEIDATVRAAGDRATDEAKHAAYLLDLVRAASDNKAPDRFESIVLEWEQAAQGALQAAGRSESFSAGLAPPLGHLEVEVTRLRSEHDRLAVTTQSRAGDSDSLQAQVDRLRDTVHDRDLEIAELRRQVADSDNVAHIQGLFRRDEGSVLVQDRDLVLRLHGVEFATGRAEVPDSARPILDKVVEAIRACPGAKIVVEGHTDTQGKPEKNLELSQQRADAVRAWIASRAGIEARSITATGYGANRPVASNDTEEGRALNRRIEIVIARPQ